MNWVDVCGPPGSGKSTLADKIWRPHELPISNILPPEGWTDFLNEITRLFHLIRKHPTFSASIRMTNRSIRKMTTVCLYDGNRPYVQTGLVQRGLGFGWRMQDSGIDINELRHFFRLMPVSIGVAVTRCDPAIVEQRNRDRLKVQETAHENRDFMVPLMQPAIELAIEVLRDRGVPVCEIDTSQPVEAARSQLVDFSHQGPCDAAQSGLSSQAPVLSPPPWWK
jgi:hypothetical protein